VIGFVPSAVVRQFLTCCIPTRAQICAAAERVPSLGTTRALARAHTHAPRHPCEGPRCTASLSAQTACALRCASDAVCMWSVCAKTSIDPRAVMAGLKYLAGICLVIAYAWACDRSGDSLGRLHPRLHPTRAQTRVRVGLAARSVLLTPCPGVLLRSYECTCWGVGCRAPASHARVHAYMHTQLR